MKKYINTLLTILAILFIWYIFIKVSESARNKQIVKTQTQEIAKTQEIIKKQDEIVKKTQKVIKRKNAIVNTSLFDDVQWLQDNSCADCRVR